MRQRKIPMRMCTGCKEMKPKKELVRVVKTVTKKADNPDDGSGEEFVISLDLTGKKPGRGAYICGNPECLKKARKERRLEKAFSCKIPDEVYERMEREIAGE